MRLLGSVCLVAAAGLLALPSRSQAQERGRTANATALRQAAEVRNHAVFLRRVSLGRYRSEVRRLAPTIQQRVTPTTNTRPIESALSRLEVARWEHYLDANRAQSAARERSRTAHAVALGGFCP